MNRKKSDTKIDYLVEKIDIMFDNQTMILDILKGKNGDPGFCEIVRNNRHDIDEIKKKQSKRPNFLIKSWQLIVQIGPYP